MNAGERDKFLRAAWRVIVAEEVDARDFVFVDECGTHTSLAPVYGYSPRGERVYLEVPRNRGPNTTLLARMSVEGMGECLAVEGATTKVLIEAYVERVLAPNLRTMLACRQEQFAATKNMFRSGFSPALRNRLLSNYCQRAPCKNWGSFHE